MPFAAALITPLASIQVFAWLGWIGLLVIGIVWLVRRSVGSKGKRELRPPAPSVPTPEPRALVDEPRRMLDAIESPLLGLGSGGEVWFANRAASAFFADRFETLIGTNAEQLFTQAQVLARIAEARDGKAGGAPIRVSTPAGMRIYQAMAFPIIEGEGRRGVVVSLRDVTDLSLAAQLKTDFVANASHELRTPLSSIRAAIETMQETTDDAPMRERLERIIAGNVTRLEELVTDLLDLSRLESDEAPPTLIDVDVPALVGTLVEMFAPICDRRHLTIEKRIDPELATLRTDRRLLSLILKNLIENATKYAYEGTAISVTGQRVETMEGPRARFEVRDKGVGIPIGMQQRIFERFFQVDASRAGSKEQRGTGLGLAIVKHAVKALGGTIGVDSVWTEGTQIGVEIPIRETRDQGGSGA